MPRTPDALDALLDQFVQDLRLRTKATSYRCIVRRFHEFLGDKGIFATVDQSRLRKWLRAQAAKSELWLVVHHAQILTRFLDWMVEQHILRENPFAELRGKYECHSTAPIVRALVSMKPSAALEALRPPPRFASHLGQVMLDHILRMRSLGFKYGHESEFLRFDRFLQGRRGAATEPLSKLIREYVASASSSAKKLRHFRLGSILAKAISRLGTPTTSVVPDRLLIREAARKRCRPFIYSPEQVQLLLKTARAYPTRRAPLRSITLYTMLVLAYCAGLRLGEIVRLELRDVDLSGGTIEIRDTKFFKSRRLPLSTSAIATLREYLAARCKAGASQEPEARLFVHEKGGYSYVTAGALLKDVIRRAGLNTGKGRGGPRVHDLRHSFVVQRMTEWYRKGINPQDRLEYLAAYLGHRDIHSTLVYLTITQDLLQHANARFRTAEADVLSVIQGGHYS